VTKGDLDTERLTAGFDLSKRLRDRAFRAHLKELGWESGQHIVPALDEEPVGQVVARMIINGTPSPCLIAIPKPEAEFGFWFLSVEVAPRSKRRWGKRTPTIEINPSASIGMLYTSLQPCGDYLPSTWTQPLRFERALAA
jgi:hypothetical protein